MKRASPLGVLLFSMACSLEPATTTPDTYADFLKLSRQLTCEASLRCCGTVCPPQTDFAFYQRSARVLDYLKANQLEYDRQAAVDCLANLQQRYTSCDASAADLPPSLRCNNILIPKGTAGSMCESSVNSCAGNSVCNNSSCKVRRSEDQACNINSTQPFCLSDTDSCCLFCSGICTVSGGIGATCNTGVPASCSAGSFCASATMRCTAYPTAGQSCSDPLTPCDPRSGLVCAPGSQTCVPPQSNGATCTTAAHCQSGYCLLPNLPLTTGGTCQPPPVPLTIREQLCQSL